MNYTDVQTFLTIAASESLSKAAESLFITQPALSHRLSSLEAELGVSLLVRGKGIRSIELTDAGRRFVPIAKKWQTLYDETSDLNLIQPLTPLRIANVDSLNVYFMPQVYTHFIQKNESCRLNVSTLRSNAAYRAVENHDIDLALITNPHFFKRVHTVPLFTESMKFLCHRDAPYQGTLSVHDLNIENEVFVPWSNPFLMWHDYWFGTNLDARISLDNMSLFEQFLKLENAWAIVPSTIAHALEKKKSFKTCDISNAPDPRTCYVINSAQLSQSPLQQDFIHTLLRVAAQFPDVRIIDQSL